MTDFLITSICCQIALFAVYKLLLENAKMHTFSRYYLLFALVFSIAIPFVRIQVETETVAQAAPQILPMLPMASQMIAAENPNPTDYLQICLWMMYAIGLCIFGYRFAKNLFRIFSSIRKNKTEERDGVTYVLLASETLPHTFLNYIFVNADDFRNGLESQLLTHEITHVRQKHSFDILFTEILKTVFWFNPMLVLYKKTIRLNHEFLADEAVVAHHDSISYQELLLSKAHISNAFSLASSFNFSITKKRMIMMTTRTPLPSKIAKTFGIAIAFFALTTFFAVESVAQNVPPPPPPPPKPVAAPSPYYAQTVFYISDSDGKTEKKRYSDLTASEKAMLPPPPPSLAQNNLSEKQFRAFSDTKRYAVWIDGKHVKNSELKNYKASDFVSTQTSKVYKNARSAQFPQPYQTQLYTEKGFDKLKNANQYPKVLEWHFDKNGNSKIGSGKIGVPTLNQWKEAASQDENASFPGGMPKFIEFFTKEFKTPQGLNKDLKLVVSFLVETDGSLSDIKILKDGENGVGQEATRVLESSPKWNPAKKDGNVVVSSYTLPVSLKAKN
ncbi:energy transducer TonB [Flavobacterium sp. MAH-1]|uniref:Energy transducer TonB n=1 Tax=Flavobacterium agri TaxID=2743471 RepID=A0A7Y8Y160_9FLAO|nr:M56 family metallopeptidase [Flavobacterium agri]NUY80667.1 energy transducer TonB [Flavobacterium agri]NYA70691.1 energy transducer TonB [Flavobacterium agri]